eukprot:TRINITY_DN8627_c0_g1_i2.p1 TRINITY_DN8627_c0_g1~~TRINITY_DN8627_c0_g1_i2.p1  ORF type:complete len:227 (+),score=28.14 TRINITY_DN8627_c0_g1_i2:59-739(+)
MANTGAAEANINEGAIVAANDHQLQAQNTTLAATDADGAARERTRSGIVPKIVNLVATINMHCQLDLRHIALHARNAEYSPKRFAAVVMRIRNPQCTALIFRSGKLVCTGTKSEDEAYKATRKFVKIIQKLDIPEASFRDFKIQNMVGSCDVRFPIRLESLAANHSAFSTYEPELFPGLIYRMVNPKCVLLIFVSGKVVITGSKKRELIHTALDNIYSILQEYRKQ